MDWGTALTPERLILAALLVVTGCKNPIRDGEKLITEGRPMDAFRTAREALKEPHAPDEQKRLTQILVTGARRIMQQPDTDNLGEALELYDGIPADLDEDHTRAAQRLLRVMARSKSPEELSAALEKLTPDLGDEAEIRSNLRAIVEANRGKPGSLWAARVVTEHWPDGWDRWVDRAQSEAALNQFDDATRSILRAEEELSKYCAALEEKMAAYDKVRRESAYGQLEAKRCGQFGTLAAHALAYASKKASTDGITPVQVDASKAPGKPCPRPSQPTASDEAIALISPQDRALEGPLVPLSAGPRVLFVKDGTGCREVKLDVTRDSAIAVRVVPLPAAPK